MRPLIATLLLFLVVVTGSAQQISPQLPIDNWGHLQTVPTATAIHVNTAASHVLCTLKSEDDESLTCVREFHDLKFTRAEIKSIKIAHRARSAWVAEGIAFVGSLLATEITNHTAKDQLGTGIVVGLAGLLALIVSPFVGFFTDFTSTTIYQTR